MSIYTTNDRELCCPLCGSPTVALVQARPSGTSGVVLVGECRSCAGTVGWSFTPRGDAATRVEPVEVARDTHRLATARSQWLDVCPGGLTPGAGRSPAGDVNESEETA